MTMETTTPRSASFWGKIGAGLLVIYATLIRGFIFWFERTRLHAVRVSIKTAWVLLTIAILIFALMPLEIESWQLWMTNKELARNLAMAIVITSFLVLEMARIAHEAKQKALRNCAYGLAALCTLLAILSGWNYLMHSAEAMRGGGSAQEERTSEAMKQANEDLTAFDAATTTGLAVRNASLAKADAGWAPTGTSKLTNAVSEYEHQRSVERRDLVSRLEKARSEAVVAHVDPRPIDIVLGNVLFGGNAVNAGIIIDLIRVFFFKFFVLFGLPLAFMVAPESAKKQEKEKLAAERARQMQGADGKFKPRKQAGLPQSENDNNSDWVAPEARVPDKPKKEKSTKKGKRWLDDVFAKNAQPVEDAVFTEDPVVLRAKDEPELGDDPRASAADQLELQEEVSDEFLAEDAHVEHEGGTVSGPQGFAERSEDRAPFNEGSLDGEHVGHAAEIEDQVLQASLDESLTHAQPEEDQQADEPLDGAALGVQEAYIQADEVAAEIVSEDQEGDVYLNAPLQTPDEQALWNEVSETSELAEPENAETPLPNGEGVLVHTDDEIEELERQYAARRAVEAAE